MEPVDSVNSSICIGFTKVIIQLLHDCVVLHWTVYLFCTLLAIHMDFVNKILHPPLYLDFHPNWMGFTS